MPHIGCNYLTKIGWRRKS